MLNQTRPFPVVPQKQDKDDGPEIKELKSPECLPATHITGKLADRKHAPALSPLSLMH